MTCVDDILVHIPRGNTGRDRPSCLCPETLVFCRRQFLARILPVSSSRPQEFLQNLACVIKS